MSKRREASPVTLTPDQHHRLENLWFVYGNHGSLTTPGNHYFIQSILEHGQDIRPLLTKRSRKSDIPTPECVSAVEAILNQPASHGETPQRTLTLVPSNTTPRSRQAFDPEVTSMLESMKRRRSPGLQRDPHDDTPEAA